MRKINDIDLFFDETVRWNSFSVTITARRCPRYPNASRGKSWAIMYHLFLTVERTSHDRDFFVPRGSQFEFTKKQREIRFTWNCHPEWLDTRGKDQSLLENKSASFQREYNSLLNFDTGIQLSLTITNDLSLEMRVTARLSEVSIVSTFLFNRFT